MYVGNYDSDDGAHRWSYTFPATGMDSLSMGYDVAIDEVGVVAATGVFGGMISFGGSTFEELAGAQVVVLGP